MHGDSSYFVRRRLKPRVILVARKNTSNTGQGLTSDVVLDSLRINPADRSSQDIDIILSCIGKWPDFVKKIPSDQERREICRRIECEDYKANSLIFKEGDQPDGWYIVFSGQCTLYSYALTDAFHEQIPPSHLSTLHDLLGHDKCFKFRAKKLPKSEFGSQSLTTNEVRNFTVFCDTSTVILRVDPRIYRCTAIWFAKTQLEKKASLLSQIPQFQFIREQSDDQIFSRLAENMVERKYDAGTLIEAGPDDDEKNHGFLVIEEGLLVRQRLVDFTGYKRSKLQQIASEMPIKIPKGKHNVRVETLGPKSMIPHPALNEYIIHPFSIQVLEPTVAYELMTTDLGTFLLNTQIQHIKNVMTDEPDDLEVINQWTSKQESVQWKLYKHKCVKDARKRCKVEKDVNNGQWGIRKAGVPRPIKDHRQYSSLIRKKYD
ncbi:cyclic nucleotide-binding domain containing protein [Tritrichomonas foetus]|uniref:Cyclic nucleotide-binding domain containing protein n=1 Tax=Tritrichomonas foetus TaxID=1144522 RepID=A0A1J4JI22_9EUKA|nr:cyclic nucleotide-binding domain containing protein [Tritrichomonas foetus]|eukprot:OHS98782.1 cyclic nucleotide-binding domain containing protein [Tritrichomonas foetus]